MNRVREGSYIQSVISNIFWIQGDPLIFIVLLNFNWFDSFQLHRRVNHACLLVYKKTRSRLSSGLKWCTMIMTYVLFIDQNKRKRKIWDSRDCNRWKTSNEKGATKWPDITMQTSASLWPLKWILPSFFFVLFLVSERRWMINAYDAYNARSNQEEKFRQMNI